MTEVGYVKIYRSLQRKGYYHNSKYVHLWVYLLMKASYQETEYLFNNNIEHLDPGQFIIGRKTIAKETGIKETTIERILSCFESEHQIGQQTNNKFRIITILNWDMYQVAGQQNGQQIDSQRTASGQPADTIKKDKKEKNKTYTSDFLLFWEEYPKRTGKDAAWLSWQKRNGSRPPIDKIISSIKEQKTTDQWIKDGGQYIPNPATWINQGRWDDEVPVQLSLSSHIPNVKDIKTAEELWEEEQKRKGEL